MAAREMGGLSLAEALSLCELLAKTDPARYERAFARQPVVPLGRLPSATQDTRGKQQLGQALAGNGYAGSRR